MELYRWFLQDSRVYGERGDPASVLTMNIYNDIKYVKKILFDSGSGSIVTVFGEYTGIKGHEQVSDTFSDPANMDGSVENDLCPRFVQPPQSRTPRQAQ